MSFRRALATLPRGPGLARGAVLLRSAASCGRFPEVTGTFRLVNRGQLHVGHRFRVSAGTVVTKVEVWAGGDLTVGDHAYLNFGVDIVATTSVRIGDNVRIAPLVSIVDDSMHDTSPGDRRRAPIVIGDNVWVGRGAVVLPGVSIGDHAVVAAGSVVSRDVPAKTLVAGVPARVLRRLEVPDDWRRV